MGIPYNTTIKKIRIAEKLLSENKTHKQINEIIKSQFKTGISIHAIKTIKRGITIREHCNGKQN